MMQRNVSQTGEVDKTVSPFFVVWQFFIAEKRFLAYLFGGIILFNNRELTGVFFCLFSNLCWAR
jgi:hypothetical protein